MLTIEELRNLKTEDFIWLVKIKQPKLSTYLTHISFTEKMFCALNFKQKWNTLRIEDYGKTWLAFKNKEEAEGRSITLPYLLCTSSKFACVIWRDEGGKVHKTYTMPIDEAKGVLKEKEGLCHINE